MYYSSGTKKILDEYIWDGSTWVNTYTFTEERDVGTNISSTFAFGDARSDLVNRLYCGFVHPGKGIYEFTFNTNNWMITDHINSDARSSFNNSTMLVDAGRKKSDINRSYSSRTV